MHEIRNLLRMAGRRLEATRFLNVLHVVAAGLAGLALLIMIADRLPGASFVPWMIAVPVLVAAALITSLSIWSAHRRSEEHVALVVDERLDLREKLSTALACEGMEDSFAQAAIEDAVKTASHPKVREAARRRFAVQAPRVWWVSPLLVFVAVMLSFVDPLDLFSRDDEQNAVTAATGQVQQSIEAIVQTIEEQPMLSRELSDIMGDLSRAGADPDALRTPDAIRREAIREVTELNKALDKLVNGEKGKTAEAIEQALGKLKAPNDGPGKELAESLARADFKAAQQALEKMLEDVKKGNLNEQEQKQQLQQMAQAQQAAQQACQGLAQAMQQMAQGAQQGQMGPGGQQMGQQLNQLEQMQMLLQQAQAAANMCQGQCQGLGQGLGLQQAMSAGGAFGNRGQGQGGRAPIAPTPTRTTIVKADTILQEGDIIARQLFDGPQIRGESKAKLQKVMADVMKGWEDGISEDQLPRVYYDPQMHYFGELEKLTKAIEENGGSAASGASTPPPAKSPDP